MDPLSIGTNIVNLAKSIKVALETVDRNKDLCSSIREKVETIDAILSSAGNYAECNSSVTNLRKALEKALDLIKDCQRKTKVRHLLTADEMSVKLGDANQTIMHSVDICTLAISLAILVKNDGEKQRENNDVKGKKNKETQEGGEKLRKKKDVEETRDTGKGRKNKETQEDGEKRREKKDVEEKRYTAKKMEIGEGKKNKETQEDGEKRREKKDVEEKRDCPGLVRSKDSSVEDHDGSSRKEEKEEYYSCSSRCSVSQLKAMIKGLPENNIMYGDYILYKAKLSDETCVRLHRIGRSGVDPVHDIRVRGMAKLEHIKHINISELLGYFSHGGFFYVVEKSFGTLLSDCIYAFSDNTSKKKELSWQQCSDIILHIADGVTYLHERGIIHMSLRASKIAIDPECVPKIYYSQILEITESVQEEGVHTSFRMERGIEPPEYELHHRFSVKTDVYCYGVLLLKLISGQRWQAKFLTESVLRDAFANNMKKWIQPRFIDAADGPQTEDIKRCIRIALLCVEKNPALRPTMDDVRGYLRDKNKNLPRIPASLRTRAE